MLSPLQIGLSYPYTSSPKKWLTENVTPLTGGRYQCEDLMKSQNPNYRKSSSVDVLAGKKREGRIIGVRVLLMHLCVARS